MPPAGLVAPEAQNAPVELWRGIRGQGARRGELTAPRGDGSAFREARQFGTSLGSAIARIEARLPATWLLATMTVLALWLFRPKGLLSRIDIVGRHNG